MGVDRNYMYPVGLAVAGAVLFGASAPMAKVLLGDIDPVVLAGLLYAGSGIGLALFGLLGRAFSLPAEARLSKPDLPWLAGSVIAGGIIGPVLLMISLKNTPAATASLLLNFEIVATTVIAAAIFREAIGKRVWLAIALITAASALLSVNISGGFGISAGSLGVLGACFFWGIDNNLTGRISSKDPVSIGIVKGLVAGAFSLSLSLMIGRPLPGIVPAVAAMCLGTVSYGLSIALFILATRGMGAARASAWFGTAPFAGTALSLVIFRSLPGVQFLLSLPFMITGALLLFGEKHTHMHSHTALVHEHYYTPDEHHPFKNKITYRHTHHGVRHSHPHRPDIHHRHDHENKKRR